VGQPDVSDVLVIGGGLAGVVAARRLLDSGARVVLVELISDLPLRARFLIDPTAVNDREMSGGELDDLLVPSPVHDWRSSLFLEASDLPERLGRAGDLWRLSSPDDEALTARAVLICPTPEVIEQYPRGAWELLGRGVSMCGWSDGSFFRGQRVAVAGDGDRAFETALFASQWASEVRVYVEGARKVRRASLRARVERSDRIRVVRGARVLAVEATPAGDVAGVHVEREGVAENVECTGVFLAHPLTMPDAVVKFAFGIRSPHDPRCIQIAGSVAGIDDDDHVELVDDALRATARLRGA
jgi:thioredoxin reductase